MRWKVSEIQQEVNIAGNGIVALMISYFCFLNARKANKPIRIVVRGQYPVTQTTASFLVPSISWNEILSVVPPAHELIELLELPFTDFKGGVSLDGEGIKHQASEFISAVKQSGHVEETQRRTSILTEFGKYSVSLWDWVFATADPELQKILRESNYRPCREIESHLLRLDSGYRTDLYFNSIGFSNKLKTTIEKSKAAGYSHVRLLSPDEVVQIDASLKEFCDLHTVIEDNTQRWKEGAGVIFRPAGCINSSYFLKAFSLYLEKVMGSYVTEENKEKPCFRLKIGKVTGVTYNSDGDEVVSFVVDGKEKQNKRNYERFFILCPGEAVGMVRNLGFKEPPYARFIGFVLELNIPLVLAKKVGIDFSGKPNFALHTGVASSCVLQARVEGDRCRIGLGGLKAFLGLANADVNTLYSLRASLHQLKMLNQLYPSLLSECLGFDTKKHKLSLPDLVVLVSKGYILRHVGSRAVAFDGVPTIGRAKKGLFSPTEKTPVNNVIVCTHLSSGGVTNATGAASCVAHILDRVGFLRTPQPVTKDVMPPPFLGSDETNIEKRSRKGVSDFLNSMHSDRFELPQEDILKILDPNQLRSKL